MPSHYLNQYWNIVNWTLSNKFQWNLNDNSYIFIQENASENVACKMASILSQPQLRELILVHNTYHKAQPWVPQNQTQILRDIIDSGHYSLICVTVTSYCYTWPTDIFLHKHISNFIFIRQASGYWINFRSNRNLYQSLAPDNRKCSLVYFWHEMRAY